MSDETSGEEKEEEYKDTPEEWARRWQMEFKAAQKELKKFQDAGDKVVKRFLDERDDRAKDDTRLNLFTANVQQKRALLFGRTPQATVTRRHADADDDVARVAGEMLERILNTDIESDSDGYNPALENSLNDRMLPGLGIGKDRYCCEMKKTPSVPAKMGPDGDELAPEVPETEAKESENVEIDYVHWKDALWNAARVWSEVRWIAFQAQMSRKALIDRFGEEIGKAVPLNAKKTAGNPDEMDTQRANPWAQANVWEIWDKESKQIFWYVDGYEKVLDMKPDTLGLESFFPCPRPMMANLSTGKLVPRSDFAIAQDVYNEIDMVSTRVTELERAIRVTGVYDPSAEGLREMVDGGRNKLFPVTNFGMLAEKGGIRSVVDFMPLDQIIVALNSLREYRKELIDLLYQVDGSSDIMRGQGTQSGVTATEQGIKAHFGSVRLQALQDEFARFATDLLRIKAEIICKHFDPQTIIDRSNILNTPDADFAQPAVALLKSEFRHYRIQVKPEAINLTDFAQLKQERMEVMQTIGGYLAQVMPLAQTMPGAMIPMLEILQWAVAGIKGGSTIEGVLDKAKTQAEQAQQQAAANPQQPPPPDPKLMAMQAKAQNDQQKGQMDMQKEQFKLQADLQRQQAEVQTEDAKQRSQTEWNLKEAQARDQMKLQHQVVSQALAPPKPLGNP